MKRKLLYFILATIPAVTFATITGEDITRSTVLVQPDDLGTMAYAETNDYYTTAAADLVYVSRDGSEPMTGDLDMDGYDITYARVVDAEVISMDNGRTLIGGKTILNIAGTTTRQLIATNSVLYIAGDINSAHWATNDYVVVLSASLATNYYKINSIDQCAVAGEPISTLGVGDYYLTCDFSGGDVPEETANTACGVVALKFEAANPYRGFTISYQAGFGWIGSGEYCDIGVGRIRPGNAPGELTSLYSFYVRNKLLGGSDDGYYAKIIFFCTIVSDTGFDVSINYSTSYSGTSSYNPTVSAFPNH